MSMKNSSDIIGNRTRDLPAFNAVLPLLDKTAFNFVKRQRRPIDVRTCLFTAMITSRNSCTIYCFCDIC